MNANHQLNSKMTISQYMADCLNEKAFHMAKVHSVFKNGINLQINNQLLFIGRQSSPLSAFGIHIENHAFQTLNEVLKVGMNIKLTSDLWTIYSRPQVLILRKTSESLIDLQLPKIQTHNLDKSPVHQLIDAAGVYSQSDFSKSDQLIKKRQHLINAYFNQQEALQQTVTELIGAGNGLTPSGDDFLQGMIMVESALNQDNLWYRMTQDALLNRKTTDVSQAYYDILFKGQVNQQWMTFFNAIQTNDKNKLTTAIKQIQTYGATSGNDTLVGIDTFIQLIQ